MVEGAKPFEDVHLRTLGIDFHDMRLGQNAWRLGLDLHKRRRLLADIVEARFAAIVAAEMKPGQFRIADGKVVEADRLALDRREVLLEQGEIVRKGLVAVDVAAWPALKGPGGEAADTPISKITGRVARYDTSYSPGRTFWTWWSIVVGHSTFIAPHARFLAGGR